MQAVILLMMLSFELYNVDGRRLNVYGFTQVYYKYSNRDDNTLALRRTRLIFKVKEGKNIQFKMQMDFLKNPALLDAFMKYRKGAFMLKLGRFLPDFTFYMPHSSTSLDFVDYPIISKTYGMWRQVGFEVSYFITHDLYVKTGFFNGPKNNYKDIDGMKDVLLKSGYSKNWINTGVYAYEKRESGKLEKIAGWYGDFRPKKYIFTVEPLFVLSDSMGVERKDLGYYVQAGLYVLSGLKNILRYEEQYVDLDSKPVPTRRIWAGIVKEFSHFKLYVNYIKGLKGDTSKDLVLQLQYQW